MDRYGHTCGRYFILMYIIRFLCNIFNVNINGDSRDPPLNHTELPAMN